MTLEEENQVLKNALMKIHNYCYDLSELVCWVDEPEIEAMFGCDLIQEYVLDTLLFEMTDNGLEYIGDNNDS